MGLNIRIEEPCHEDWDKMTIGVINRHCNQCDKEVHDFTGMSRSDILEFMLLHTGQSVCGRFRKDQLDYTLEEINDSMNSILSRTLLPFQKELIITAAAVMMSSCQSGGTTKTPTGHSSPQKTAIQPTEPEDTIKVVVRDTTYFYEEVLTIDDHKSMNREDHLDNKEELVVVADTIIKEYPVTTIHLKSPYEPIIMGALPIRKFRTNPYFRFGLDSLQNFVREQLKDELRQMDSGKVLGIEVRIKINRRGRVRDVRVIEAHDVDEKLQKKVKRAIRKSKDWVPSRNNKNKRQSTYLTTTLFLKND